MKITFDLPEDLVRQLKLRALRDRRKLKDAVADSLRAGLQASSRADAPIEKPAQVVTDKKTGLPVIQCRCATPSAQELTPDRAAEILAAQEAEWATA